MRAHRAAARTAGHPGDGSQLHQPHLRARPEGDPGEAGPAEARSSERRETAARLARYQETTAALLARQAAETVPAGLEPFQQDVLAALELQRGFFSRAAVAAASGAAAWTTCTGSRKAEQASGAPHRRLGTDAGALSRLAVRDERRASTTISARWTCSRSRSGEALPQLTGCREPSSLAPAPASKNGMSAGPTMSNRPEAVHVAWTPQLRRAARALRPRSSPRSSPRRRPAQPSRRRPETCSISLTPRCAASRTARGCRRTRCTRSRATSSAISGSRRRTAPRRWNGREWLTIDMPDREVSNYIRSLAAARNCVLWFGREAGGLVRLKRDPRHPVPRRESFTIFGTAQGLPAERVPQRDRGERRHDLGRHDGRRRGAPRGRALRDRERRARGPAPVGDRRDRGRCRPQADRSGWRGRPLRARGPQLDADGPRAAGARRQREQPAPDSGRRRGCARSGSAPTAAACCASVAARSTGSAPPKACRAGW